MLAECLPDDFEWTSLQIDIQSVVEDQVNSCQVGRVACLLLGDFVGGSLHCRLSGGCALSDSTVVLASVDRAIVIDAGQYYFSDKFTGKRIAIMAYNHVSADTVSQDTNFRSTKLGSLYPSPIGGGSVPSAVFGGRGLPPAAANASRDGEGVPLACPGVGGCWR